MATKPLQTPKYYAQLIVDYLKQQPNYAVDDPLKVRDALELSNTEFKSGVEWCVAHKIITLEKPLDLDNGDTHDKEGGSNYEEAIMQGAASKLSSMLKQPVAAEA